MRDAFVGGKATQCAYALDTALCDPELKANSRPFDQALGSSPGTKHGRRPWDPWDHTLGIDPVIQR
jgi:hypothetical protein